MLYETTRFFSFQRTRKLTPKTTISANAPQRRLKPFDGSADSGDANGHHLLQAVESPHGIPVSQRQALQDQFVERMSVGSWLSRSLVSYQGNKSEPGLRWMKYKEGFSRSLVRSFLEDAEPESVLDPFAGIGTVPLTAADVGALGTGIEIMPVGVMAARAMAEARNGLDRTKFEIEAVRLLDRISSTRQAAENHRFRHVRITEMAFPKETESDLAKANEFISCLEDRGMVLLLKFACMSVLEEISYTRKDGQYLRWDYRSGRKLRSKVDKGPISSLIDALDRKLRMIERDFARIREGRGEGHAKFIEGSCLRTMSSLPTDSYDVIFTSPPYANRYDYTRTYALELAWLGLDQAGFSNLRQEMVTATVENRPKRDWLGRWTGNEGLWAQAVRNYESDGALKEVVDGLTQRKAELSNQHVVRLIEGYFLELAYVIAEMARVTRPGGEVVMVNDNVQYHGEQVPVDLILSNLAEKSGFECENIWMLPRGKGNSSQQMGRYGRTEIRKCVYRWRRRSG